MNLKKETSNNGLPDALKEGIESMSGLNAEQVTVHFNSDKPAQVTAQAYARGSEIHKTAESHLPRDAWHVIQQAEGRIKPTSAANKPEVNDEAGLEKEADVMGEKAAETK